MPDATFRNPPIKFWMNEALKEGKIRPCQLPLNGLIKQNYCSTLYFMYYLVFEVSRELQEAALVVQALIQGQFPFSWFSFLNYICAEFTQSDSVSIYSFFDHFCTVYTHGAMARMTQDRKVQKKGTYCRVQNDQGKILAPKIFSPPSASHTKKS